jgi:DNA-binding transcriptional LysR family regulator
LAAGEGTLLYTLGSVVQRFAARTDVNLRILTRDREGILAALSDGEAHLGVVPLATVPDGFAATKLWRSGQMLVFRRGHPLANKRRVHLRDLDGERLVLPAMGRPHREFVARALGAAGVSYEVSVEAGGWELILRYAELGVGLAIVNDICRVPRGALSRPLPELPALDYYVVSRASHELSSAALELKASIQALAAKG